MIPEKSQTQENPLNRRDFLKTSVLAGGGILLAPSIVRAQSSGGIDSDLNIALVGMGAQGRVLLDAMLGIPNLKFRAVCDIWEYSRRYGQRKLAKEGHTVNTYENIEEMIAKETDLDAAIIATPDFWHARHTNLCLNAGINVYCEKMMARTADEARSMVRAAKDTGKLLQIGHQRRSNPRYIHVLENLIKKAKLTGRITNANGQWNRAVTPDLKWPKKYEIPQATLDQYGFQNMHQFRNWRWFRDLSGGPISDLGAHQIDIFNWYFGGPPKSIMASGGADYFPSREWYDNVMAIFEYDTPDGTARAFYQTLTTTSAGGGYYEYFMGDEGSIRMSENPKITQVFREDRAPEWEDWVKLNYIRRTAAPAEPNEDTKIDVRETAPLISFDVPISLNKPIHQPHLENFFSAIRGEAKLNADGEHSFLSEAAIFRVNEAVDTRSIIELKPEDFVI